MTTCFKQSKDGKRTTMYSKIIQSLSIQNEKIVSNKRRVTKSLYVTRNVKTTTKM